MLSSYYVTWTMLVTIHTLFYVLEGCVSGKDMESEILVKIWDLKSTVQVKSI